MTNEPSIDVVAAVIMRDGNVLCAKRPDGGRMPSVWEFPGGKIGENEHPTAALTREIHEELGCEIEVGAPITTTTHIYDFATVRLSSYFCTVRTGEPVALEHAQLAWMRPSHLHALNWAEADLPAVDLVIMALAT